MRCVSATVSATLPNFASTERLRGPPCGTCNSQLAARTIPYFIFSFKPDPALSGILLTACIYACMRTRVLRRRTAAMALANATPVLILTLRGPAHSRAESTTCLRLDGPRHRRNYIYAPDCVIAPLIATRRVRSARSTVFFHVFSLENGRLRPRHPWLGGHPARQAPRTRKLRKPSCSAHTAPVFCRRRLRAV